MNPYSTVNQSMPTCGCDSFFVYMPLCLQPYGQSGQSDIHKQPLPPLPGEMCFYPSFCISFYHILLFRTELSHIFCPLSSHCYVLTCHGWLKCILMPMVVEVFRRCTKVSFVTFVFLLFCFFLSGSQRRGAGTV